MILEIINPSDAVTIEADDIVAAGLCTILICSGKCGLENENGESVMPIFLFGGANDWLKEKGVTDIDTYISANYSKMVDVCDSLVYGSISQRGLFKTAISHMKPEEIPAFKAAWNDIKRSSLNDFGKAFYAYATKLRKLNTVRAMEVK